MKMKLFLRVKRNCKAIPVFERHCLLVKLIKKGIPGKHWENILTIFDKTSNYLRKKVFCIKHYKTFKNIAQDLIGKHKQYAIEVSQQGIL